MKIRTSLAAGAALVGLLALGGQALAEAPTVRDLARTVRLSDPHVSPDGKTIAFVESRADLDADVFKTEIWLADVTTHAVRPFTQGRDHAAAPAWSPDGAALAFLAPDADKHLQIFLAPMDGGDARQLTHAKASISQFAWRPDGAAIAYAVQDEAPELKGEAKYDKLFRVGHDDFTQTGPVRPSHLWLIALSGGEAKRLTEGAWSLPVILPPGPPASPIKWTADGKTLLFVRQESPASGDRAFSRIEALDVASGAIRDLTGAKTLEGYPLLSPDGQSVIYWRKRGGEAWTFQDIWSAPFAGGPGKDLTAATLDKNVFGTRWEPDGKTLLVGASVDATVGLWRMTPQGQVLARLDLGDLVPANSFWMSYDELPDGRIVTIAETPTHPDELYLLDKDGGHPTALTHVNAFADNLTLARSEVVTWKAPGGRVIDGVLTYPVDYKSGERAPLVLYIHGGPAASSKHEFNLMPQVMASKGLMVFEPNYRGSDNLDGAFLASIYKDAGQGPGEDVMAGVKMLQDKGLVDPARMAVTGWSYGGFMTVWLAGHYPVWKAAVAGAAVTDWREMYDISDGNVGVVRQTGISPYVPGGWAANWAQSPADSQTRITAPTLILSDVG
ncbi:MAG: S9 family peptidase, partial [Alphaproteobacteria bacterium]|nr:S9 family peptidase [Alphaproteobacteria bacterium]